MLTGANHDRYLIFNGTLHDFSEFEWRICEVDSPDTVQDSVVFYRNDFDKFDVILTVHLR